MERKRHNFYAGINPEQPLLSSGCEGESIVPAYSNVPNVYCFGQVNAPNRIWTGVASLKSSCPSPG